jgi:hypothetical protein
MLRNRFAETWTGTELGVSGLDDWMFKFQLTVKEENACDGYACNDVVEKFKKCKLSREF